MEREATTGPFGRVGSLPLLIAGLIVVAICGGLLLNYFGQTEQQLTAEPYMDGLELAQESAAVQAALGEPVVADFRSQGAIHVQDGNGSCDMSVPIRGTNAAGVLFVEATMTDSVWTYDRLELVVDGSGEKIELRE